MRLFHVNVNFFFHIFYSNLFSGIGDAAVNRSLASLNLVRSIDSKTLKKREREKLAQQWKKLGILHDTVEHEKSWYIYLEFEI